MLIQRSSTEVVLSVICQSERYFFLQMQWDGNDEDWSSCCLIDWHYQHPMFCSPRQPNLSSRCWLCSFYFYFYKCFFFFFCFHYKAVVDRQCIQSKRLSKQWNVKKKSLKRLFGSQILIENTKIHGKIHNHSEIWANNPLLARRQAVARGNPPITEMTGKSSEYTSVYFYHAQRSWALMIPHAGAQSPRLTMPSIGNSPTASMHGQPEPCCSASPTPI